MTVKMCICILEIEPCYIVFVPAIDMSAKSQDAHWQASNQHVKDEGDIDQTLSEHWSLMTSWSDNSMLLVIL
jgi:hypothetical protein